MFKLRCPLLYCSLFVVLLIMAGCEPPSAIAPFYQQSDVIFDKDLAGKWISGYGKDVVFLELKGIEEGKRYEATLQSLGKESSGEAVLFRFQGATFIDIEPHGDGATGASHDYLAHGIHAHTVFYLKKTDGRLDIAPLSDLWLAEVVPVEKRATAQDMGVILLMRTPELQDILALALKEPAERIKEHHFFVPDDSEEAHKDAIAQGNMKLAQKAMGEGDFIRASRYAEAALALRPEEPSMHLVRAAALIARNQPAAARKETESWDHLCPVWATEYSWQTEECEGENKDLVQGINGVAFFAERKWQESYDALEYFYQHTEYVKDEARLLQELALYSMGKKKEAMELIRRQKDQPETAKFMSGETTAEAYFEEAKKLSTATQAMACFTIASRYLADGDQEKAREWFERELTFSYDSIYSTVAQARMLQLYGVAQGGPIKR